MVSLWLHCAHVLNMSTRKILYFFLFRSIKVRVSSYPLYVLWCESGSLSHSGSLLKCISHLNKPRLIALQPPKSKYQMGLLVYHIQQGQ
jgi:hypothetical protein